MESLGTRPAFRVLGIRSVSYGALRRSFFGDLWEVLGVKPVSGIAWSDEDVLFVGTGLNAINIDEIPMTPAHGDIDLWVDDIEAAAKSLAARGIRMGDGLPSAGRVCAGFNIFSERILHSTNPTIQIRLSQAPPELVTAIVA